MIRKEKKGKSNSATTNLIREIIEQYDVKSVGDIENALKDIMGETIKEMMEVEMDEHIGAQKNHQSRERDNYRNGYKPKKVISSYGELDLEVPQDRNSSFNSSIVPKRSKDISEIDNKIIKMYARGMTTSEISETIYDIYGFDVDDSFVSRVTDKILPMVEDWKSRPLSKVYPVVFIDATVFSVREEGKVSKKAAYIILGIDIEGHKDVLSIEVGDTESSKFWFGVLSALKARGLKDILVLCSDRLRGIKEAIEGVYPNTEWQGCIVHQIRNTMKYFSYKHYKEVANDLKTIYKANTEEEALRNLDIVKEKWDKVCKGCMDSWYNNWDNIAPMFSYGEEFRRLVYTTNAIESLNSQYKRLNKSRPVFPSKIALSKALYLATIEITKKWSMPIRNWGVCLSEIIAIFGRERVEA